MSQLSGCCPDSLRGTTAIHTRKITDSCRDKDCIEDLHVYLSRESQEILDNAPGVRPRCAELIYAYMNVEPVAFQNSHYCIDITFYYRILADTVCGCAIPQTLYGPAVFSKRAVLCGEDSRAKIFSSDAGSKICDALTPHSFNHPTAVVEVLDPMILSSRIRPVCDCPCCDQNLKALPAPVQNMFGDELVLNGERKRLCVTLGQFSMIRLERDTQILVPSLASPVPTKDCSDTAGSAEEPCEMFSRIPFPVGQFFPGGCECRGTAAESGNSCDSRPEPRKDGQGNYTTTGKCD